MTCWKSVFYVFYLLIKLHCWVESMGSWCSPKALNEWMFSFVFVIGVCCSFLQYIAAAAYTPVTTCWVCGFSGLLKHDHWQWRIQHISGIIPSAFTACLPADIHATAHPASILNILLANGTCRQSIFSHLIPPFIYKSIFRSKRLER